MQGDHRDDATTTTPHVVNPNGGEKQAEIYTHDAPWLIYACNWSVRFCLLFYVCVVFAIERVVFVVVLAAALGRERERERGCFL